MTAVCANHQFGANINGTKLSFSAHADDAVAFGDYIGRFRLHTQIKFGIALGMVGHKVQKVPLRHQGDEFAVPGHVREIADDKSHAANFGGQFAKLVMGNFQEFIEQAKLVHQLESGRMYRVTSEIAQEVCVFFEDQNFYAGSRKQVGEYHAGGSAAHYAAAHVDFLYCGLFRHGQSCSLLATPGVLSRESSISPIVLQIETGNSLNRKFWRFHSRLA